MIKFENTEVVGWEAAIRGMRNPKNSWEKSDSGFGCWQSGHDEDPWSCDSCDVPGIEGCNHMDKEYIIGPNDHDLMMKLAKAGADHRKFMRMIVVYVDITAPLYWWKEYSTYKVGTVTNSCSTMHKIHEKEFTLEDFSCEHLFDRKSLPPYEERLDIGHCDPLAAVDVDGQMCYYTPKTFLEMTCNMLNHFRELYLKTKDKKYWWQMIQLLPSSYNQRRTVMLNYEVLANIYKSRKNHKLDEWRELCSWIETLPYSELITGSNASETVSGTDTEQSSSKAGVEAGKYAAKGFEAGLARVTCEQKEEKNNMTENKKMLLDIRDEMLDILTNDEWNQAKKGRYKKLVEQSIELLDKNKTE